MTAKRLPDSPVQSPSRVALAPRSLVLELGDALERRNVNYCCQWKGNWKKKRWMSGEGDIDLLVDRSTEPLFSAVLEELGFHRATPPPQSRVAGMESCFGLDPVTGRLIHVHVHYQLLTGGFWTTIYRLPLERALLQSTTHGNVFRTPAPEFELLIFVIRMVQRHRWRDVLRGEPQWLKAIQGELDALLKKAELHRLAGVMSEHLPTISMLFVDDCLASLRPGYSRWGRVMLRRQLHRHLQSHAKRPPTAQRLMRKAQSLLTLGGRLGGGSAKKRLAHGGTVIALLGGDGSGKSTCTQELAAWLSGDLDVMTAHLGRPPRSLLTLFVGALLKVWRRFKAEPEDPTEFPGYLQCVRDVCTARDRHSLYLTARRFALSGGIALCERYPMPQNYELAGPRLDRFADRLSRNVFGRLLLHREHRYYQDILAPDVLIVLRIDPEMAVQRKTTEPADYVRARNISINAADWSGSGAHFVEAGRPLANVIADLKTIIWAEL
ncbi:MAG TPA: nucleotidyltransferase family protein [Gemmatimonadales bacterium]|nr:nucleotidyltransferase family protein [Gemmatimonadales bacterium]